MSEIKLLSSRGLREMLTEVVRRELSRAGLHRPLVRAIARVKPRGWLGNTTTVASGTRKPKVFLSESAKLAVMECIRKHPRMARREVGAKFGVSASTIGNIVKRAASQSTRPVAFTPPPALPAKLVPQRHNRGGGRTYLTDAQRESLREDYKAGHKWRRMAKRYKVSSSTVYKILLDAGLVGKGFHRTTPPPTTSTYVASKTAVDQASQPSL